MELEIRLGEGTSDAEVASLLEWLRRERDLQGRVRAQRRAPKPEELGGSFELISVAVGSGGIATAFVTSLGSWLSSRRTEQSVTVTLDGKSVQIVRNGADVIDEAELLRLIKQTLDEQ
ncbi:effector-associated constant component EACC1 [Streptomyces sp. CA-249302]|uniref:effector-associated constant component EACC1 n=1 Tax=Streptomyces sp. CA-249302 TaxID=3240058 RepID=UPI003D902391